jgi:hypothetical protein
MGVSDWATTAGIQQYFWARHPDIAGDGVYRGPRCLAACLPVPPVRPRHPVPAPRLVTIPVTQKALSSEGKGL